MVLNTACCGSTDFFWRRSKTAYMQQDTLMEIAFVDVEPNGSTCSFYRLPCISLQFRQSASLLAVLRGTLAVFRTGYVRQRAMHQNKICQMLQPETFRLQIMLNHLMTIGTFASFGSTNLSNVLQTSDMSLKVVVFSPTSANEIFNK